MGVILKPDYLRRYKDIAMLLIKYGDTELVKHAGLEEVLNGDAPSAKELKGKAEELTEDLEKLGPAFVKVGQMLSTRPDLLPAPYLEALSKLQDNCQPFPFAEVEKIVVDELGVRLSNAFLEFDPEPLAAASLGQIHHAVMRSGREVAVKVQRPGIREGVVQDLNILAQVAEFYDKNTQAGKRYEYGRMLDEFRKSIMEELDYRKEASNLDTLKENLKSFSLIVVPRAIADYTTSKVLTMEFIKGQKITRVSKLEQLELDGAMLAEEVFKAYLKQILIDGFFHADPHPGNVFLTSDKKIALLDLGMVARLTPIMQGKLLQLILAISEGRSDAAANVALEIGEPKENLDEAGFRKHINDLIQNQLSANIEEMQVGKVIVGITKAAAENDIRVPAELTMLGKTLLNLDQVGRTLDPEFNPNQSVRRNAVHIMQQRLLKSVSPGNAFTGLIETKDFLEHFPARLNRILDLVASNKIHVKVDTIDESLLVDAFQKVANRITTGLVLAALIIGAALLMRVPTSFTILGYPGLAITCFLLAAGCGFALLWHIIFYDQKPQKFDT